MTDQTAKEILQGGAELPVTFTDGSTATVFVREVTVEEILEGKYVELLRTDYAALLEYVCQGVGASAPVDLKDTGPEGPTLREAPGAAFAPGWPRRLTRESWQALRELEDRLNFTFALTETEAAHTRGQRLKFVDEQILEQSERLLKTMGSLTPSASSAGSRGPAKKRPVATPSAGSNR